MTPGLWIAPFSGDKHSQVARKHADWILRSCNGTPVNSANCGIQILSFLFNFIAIFISICMYVCIHLCMHVYMYICMYICMYNCHYSWGVVPCITAVGKFFYGMDATNPAVQQYVRDTLHLVVEGWGFEYLKLDFLYSAVLGARDGTLMNRTKSGAQAMAEGMDLVRDTLLSIKKDDKEAAAAVTLLGCGAALGSTIGKVHITAFQQMLD